MGLIELGGIAALGSALGLYPGIEHLLKFKRIERGWNPPEAVEFLGEHIARANQSIDIVDSRLNPFLFDPLASLTAHQLEKKSKLKFRFITSSRLLGLRSTPSEPFKNKLFEEVKTGRFGERLQMKVAKNPEKDNFGLIDITHFYYIKGPIDPESVSCEVTIHINSALGVAKLQSRFEEMWETAREAPLEQIEVMPHRLELADPERVQQILKEIEVLPILQSFEASLVSPRIV